jgi:tRNA (guanine37-N1)-methyltransferase
VIAAADALLEPIVAARGEYNHLSVRSACAIALDRLLGAR